MPFRNDPKHWRERAEQMRSLAAQARDLDTISIMLRPANDYDKLGDRAAARATKPPPPREEPGPPTKHPR